MDAGKDTSGSPAPCNSTVVLLQLAILQVKLKKTELEVKYLISMSN
jgi:hypothetical protein